MNILHLFPYLPTPANFGGAIRMYHILKHLHENHNVTVGGYTEHGDLNQFREEFPGLSGHSHFLDRKSEKYHRLKQLQTLFTPHSYWYNWAQSRRLEETLNRVLESRPFDLILSEFATMGHFTLRTDAVRVLDAHNVEWDNFRRMSTLGWSPLRKAYYKREYLKCRVEEREIFQKQHAIFATSRRDAEMIRADVPKTPIFVVPNGVDTRFFCPEEEVSPEPASMVFTGAMGYVPNYDGIMNFLDHVFPRIRQAVPDAKIYVVGGNPPETLRKRQSDSVIVTGYVDDVRPWIERAAVYVVPLHMGSGTRLKVVEALSMKKPIVTTTIGCEGIDVEDGLHLLVRDSPEAFAEAVVQLIRDRKLAQRLVDDGYELVRNRYDWQVIGGAIESAIQQLVSTPSTGNRDESRSPAMKTEITEPVDYEP